jgi:putative membrane protein
MSESNQTENVLPLSKSTLISRSVFGGMLMGLANLVPGISGGTMLLAAGIYPIFIESLASVTRFRFRFRSILTLGCVVLTAGVAILFFAGTIKSLVVEQRWVMYSLFIGLTLGGVPLVWRLARPASPSLIIAAVMSCAAMIGLAVLQSYDVVGSADTNFLTLVCAGLAGASAMILPGLSGAYLLLLMGQYVPILAAIHEFKDALSAREFSAAMEPAFSVLLPVGIGVILGVVLVGNLLEWLLRRFHKATLGVLLGLLIGSVAGLWPFQMGEQPKVGDTFKAQIVTAASLAEIDEEDWPTVRFTPTVPQAAISLGLIGLGLALTVGISLIGGAEAKPEE